MSSSNEHVPRSRLNAGGLFLVFFNVCAACLVWYIGGEETAVAFFLSSLFISIYSFCFFIFALRHESISPLGGYVVKLVCVFVVLLCVRQFYPSLLFASGGGFVCGIVASLCVELFIFLFREQKRD